MLSQWKEVILEGIGYELSTNIISLTAVCELRCIAKPKNFAFMILHIVQ